MLLLLSLDQISPVVLPRAKSAAELLLQQRCVLRDLLKVAEVRHGAKRLRSDRDQRTQLVIATVTVIPLDVTSLIFCSPKCCLSSQLARNNWAAECDTCPRCSSACSLIAPGSNAASLHVAHLQLQNEFKMGEKLEMQCNETRSCAQLT